jgi:hypothetical protein
MGDWGVEGSHVYETVGANTTTTRGTTVSSAAGLNTKGSYAELTAATVRDWVGFWVSFSQEDTASVESLLDIAIGAGGSEQVLVGEIPRSGKEANPSLSYFPLSIGAGTRIAVRSQDNVAGVQDSSILLVGVSRNWSDSVGFSVVETVGALTASSNGVSVDAGGVAHTKGAYQQLIASTIRDYTTIVLHLNGEDVTLGFSDFLFDLAIGAGGSEQILLADVYVAADAISDSKNAISFTFPMEIAAGTRIAMRCQTNETAAGQRQIRTVLHGLA